MSSRGEQRERSGLWDNGSRPILLPINLLLLDGKRGSWREGKGRQRENNQLDCVVPLQFDVKYTTEYEIFPTRALLIVPSLPHSSLIPWPHDLVCQLAMESPIR